MASNLKEELKTLYGNSINIVNQLPKNVDSIVVVVKHDSFYNHVYDIRLGDFGKQMVFELAKHIMFD